MVCQSQLLQIWILMGDLDVNNGTEKVASAPYCSDAARS